jgi:hypothetical protein
VISATRRTTSGRSGQGAAEVTVGITAFAVEQLGDITLVNLDVKVGDTVTAGKAFGTIESVKTLSDLFAPMSGKVVKRERRPRGEARARERGLLEGLDDRDRAVGSGGHRRAHGSEGLRRSCESVSALKQIE